MSPSLTLVHVCVWICVRVTEAAATASALRFYKCRCSPQRRSHLLKPSPHHKKSFPRQLLETKWVLWFDLIYKEQRSIIIWRRVVEEEASRAEGTDFSKGKNDKQKTTKRRPHFISSFQMWLKCWKCETKAVLKHTEGCKIMVNLLFDLFVLLSLNTEKWSTVVGHKLKDKACGIKR